MINSLIEKYEKKKKRNDESYAKFKEMKNYSFMGDCETKEVIYKEIIKDLEELKIKIDKLAKDKNFLENYYYDDMVAKGKISKELYAKFKGLGGERMTAKEMFEKLRFNDCKKIYDGDDDLIAIEYWQNPYKNGTIRMIDFHCLKEKVLIEDSMPLIDMKLLNAINKQIEELGWLE